MDSADTLKKLWMCVLERALEDATGNVMKEDWREVKAAKDWLLYDEVDFPDVCIMAGYHPQDIRKLAREKINESD